MFFIRSNEKVAFNSSDAVFQRSNDRTAAFSSAMSFFYGGRSWSTALHPSLTFCLLAFLSSSIWYNFLRHRSFEAKAWLKLYRYLNPNQLCFGDLKGPAGVMLMICDSMPYISCWEPKGIRIVRYISSIFVLFCFSLGYRKYNMLLLMFSIWDCHGP